MSKIKNGIDYYGINSNGTATQYVSKTLNIGNWNMDSTTGATVAHGLTSTEWKFIKNPTGIIRNDADTSYYSILPDGGGGLNSDCYINYFDSTNIYLARKTSVFFDNTNFDTAVYNRGFVSFIYKPD